MRGLMILISACAITVMVLQITTSANKAAVGAANAIQGNRCFDVDPGIGNPSRDDHYRWAQQFDSTKVNSLIRGVLEME